MEDRLRRRLAMLNAVLAHFDESPDLWTDHAPIVKHVGTVRAGRDAITAAAEDQARHDPEGLTTDRDAARNRAEALLAEIGGPAATYATDTGDDALRRAVDRSLTDWHRLAEADFFSHAADALDRLDRAPAEIVGYGVSRDDVAEARAAVAAARPLTASRDDTAAHRAVATDTLDTAYSSIVPSLDALDTLVPRLIEDAAFVAAYRELRKIPGD